MRPAYSVAVVALLTLAGCSASTASTEPSVPPVASATPTPSASATPTPTSVAPSAAEQEDGYLFTLAYTEGQMGADFGELSELDRVALGYTACSQYDTGADFQLTQAALTLEDAASGLNDEARWAVAIAAAQSLCVEHADQIPA